MKLSKRKLRILFIALSILSILVVFLCSFSFRPSKYQISYYSSRPSVEAVQNLMSIVQYQKDLNGFNRSDNILLMSCRFVSGSGYRIEVYISSNSSFNFTVNGDVFAFTFSGTQVYYYNNSTGFYGAISAGSDSINVKDIYYSSVALPETSIPGFQGFNSNATFGSSNFNSYDVMSYFKHIHDAALHLDEYVSEAFSEGLAIGQGEGYQVGLEDGYNQGYVSGFADGEDRGYAEGQSEGYSEGYSEGESVGYSSGHRDGFEEGRDEGYQFGFDAGYSEGESFGYSSGHREGYDVGRDEGYSVGFSDGYETGYQSGINDGGVSEPLQIFTAYIFRFDENNSLQYFSYRDSLNIFSWIDYESRFDPTKPPYTFSVRLTESDLNNSSTQIELPFDFLSSPGNQDYSVGSFDPDFLTGYGKSLSLFVTTSRSYNNGYNVGFQDGADLLDGISDISAKPIAALRDALDFELFGVNVGLVVVALVSVFIVFAAYKFVKKLFPI